jgi:hypothetical protein
MIFGDKMSRHAAMRAVALGAHMMVLGSLSLIAPPTAWSQERPLTITLAGQAMLRSDLRDTDPAAVTAWPASTTSSADDNYSCRS